jgi:hypothetical protein
MARGTLALPSETMAIRLSHGFDELDFKHTKFFSGKQDLDGLHCRIR